MAIHGFRKVGVGHLCAKRRMALQHVQRIQNGSSREGNSPHLSKNKSKGQCIYTMEKRGVAFQKQSLYVDRTQSREQLQILREKGKTHQFLCIHHCSRVTLLK